MIFKQFMTTVIPAPISSLGVTIIIIIITGITPLG